MSTSKPLTLATLKDVQASAYYIRDADTLSTARLIADSTAISRNPQWRKAKHAAVVRHKIASVLTERGIRHG